MRNLSQRRSQKRWEENYSINKVSLGKTMSAMGADRVEMFHHSPFTPTWRSRDFWKGYLRRVGLEAWRLRACDSWCFSCGFEDHLDFHLEAIKKVLHRDDTSSLFSFADKN